MRPSQTPTPPFSAPPPSEYRRKKAQGVVAAGIAAVPGLPELFSRKTLLKEQLAAHQAVLLAAWVGAGGLCLPQKMCSQQGHARIATHGSPRAYGCVYVGIFLYTATQAEHMASIIVHICLLTYMPICGYAELYIFCCS